MAVNVRTQRPDARLKRIVRALEEYAQAHPDAEIDVYRYDDVSVRVRIIDPAFKGVSRARREDDLWRILDKVPEESVADINVLLLLTPDETKTSIGSLDFDNPLPPLLPSRKAR